MTTYLPDHAPGGPTPPPSGGVVLLVILLIVGGALVAVAIVWPTYATACGIVVALLTAILREIHHRPPRA